MIIDERCVMCEWCKRCRAFIGDVGNLRGIGGSWRTR